ncbi:MAG: hypothetical protein ACREI9_11465 [Nitrospiraceae bacterium]
MRKNNRLPYDLYSRYHPSPPLHIPSAPLPRALPQEKENASSINLRTLSWIAFSNSFARFQNTYEIRIGISPILVREYQGGKDIFLYLYNNDLVGANPIFISPSASVSSQSGFPLASGERLSIILSTDDKLFAIAEFPLLSLRIAEFSPYETY